MDLRVKVHHWVDKLIPPCLIVILIILVLEIFFHDIAVKYHTAIEMVDYVIILIFATDLYFKYKRLKEKSKFFRKYWLEIIAIFPFMLVFRATEFFFAAEIASKELKQAQMALHETVEVEKAAKGSKAMRTARFTKILRPLLRAPRFFKAATFF